MKKILLVLAACSMIATYSMLAACSGSSDNSQGSGNGNGNGNGKPNAEAAIWAKAADSLNYVLVDQFMDKDKGIFWGTAQKGNPAENQYLYWQQAHYMNVLVYAYERLKKSEDPADLKLAQEYEGYFQSWFKNYANNWGSSDSFRNNFTDDMCWIALTLLHMTEATGDEKYYQAAKDLYDKDIITRGWEDSKGWALPWKGDDKGRNICTNAPGCAVACKLYQKTNDEKYLNDAQTLYEFIITNLMKSDGRLEEPPLTYTQGTFAEAARLLYHITKDRSCLTRAELAITYTMTGGRCNNGSLLRDEGSSGDQSVFKAVFVPYAVNLALDEATSFKVREQIRTFLLTNARTLWYDHLDRDAWPRMFCHFFWGTTWSAEDEAKHHGSPGAHASGASLIENVARLTKEYK